jgi:halocyanin-like protein
LSFWPAAAQVDPGTTVTWQWTGRGGGHNVVAESGEFETDIYMEDGATFEHTFEESGTYLYYCAPHRPIGMKGAIVVDE